MLLNISDISSFYVFGSWTAELKLLFALRDSRSVLVKRWHRGPFFIQKPFYYEDNLPHVYLLHPPSGLVSGDYLNLEVSLEQGSQVLFTMPGATKFYRSNGRYVYVKQKFNLGKHSTLEWLPHCNIFFSQCKVIIDTIFHIEQGACLIFFETFCFGRLGFSQEFDGCILNAFLSISLNKAIGLRERIKVDHLDSSILNLFFGYQLSAIFIAFPVNAQILSDVRTLIRMCDIKVGGATLLGELLVVRLLDNQNECIQKILRDLWCFVRPIIIRRKAVVPRIWST